ncbi:MAG TPA: hypothetical protein DCQ93_07690 [Bacteroidetes bacterium]|nr:hypothetical protein [Bacteroidota bacterium]
MKKLLNIFSIVLLLCFIGGAFISSVNNPEYNTDLLFYTGIYYQNQGDDIVKAHSRVYDYKLMTFPDEVQAQLTSTEMEKRCRDSASYFDEILPFCKVKLLYNLSVQWLTPLSGSPILSMLYISILSYSLISLLLFFLLRKFIHTWLASIITICICSFTPIQDSGKIFTPDALSALLIFSGLMFLVFEKSFWFTMIFWLAAIMTRPENILFPIMFATFLIWKTRNEIKRTISPVTVVVLSFAVYLFTTRVTGSYGWKITFQHSLINTATLPSEWKNIPLTIATYFTALLREIINHKTGILFLVFLFMLSFFSLKNIQTEKRNISLLEIYLLLSGVFALKFFVHPFFDERFFILFYVISFAFISIGILPGRKTIIHDTDSLSS